MEDAAAAKAEVEAEVEVEAEEDVALVPEDETVAKQANEDESIVVCNEFKINIGQLGIDIEDDDVDKIYNLTGLDKILKDAKAENATEKYLQKISKIHTDGNSDLPHTVRARPNPESIHNPPN